MNVPKLRFKEFTDEWQHDKICNVTTYVDYRGKTPNKTETGIFLVTAKNVKKGYIDYDCSKEYVAEIEYEEIMHRGKPKVGDVLITTEAPCGNVAQIDKENIALAQRVIKYRGNALIDNTFLKYEFLSNYFQNELKKVTSGGTVSGVKGSILHNMEIHYCSKEEQLMLSSFLTLLDKKIELQTKKIEDLKLYKKGLNKTIFKNCNNKYQISDIIVEYTEKTAINNQYEVLSSTANGIYLQSKYFNKQAASEDNTGYKIVPKNFITYRSMSDTGEFHFNIQNLIDYGIVSPAYPVFNIDENLVNKDYFVYYINENSEFKNNILHTKEGGTRYALSISKFKSIYAFLPSREEQNRLAKLLKNYNNKLDIEILKLYKLEQLKKGLMQKMFA